MKTIELKVPATMNTKYICEVCGKKYTHPRRATECERTCKLYRDCAHDLEYEATTEWEGLRIEVSGTCTKCGYTKEKSVDPDDIPSAIAMQLFEGPAEYTHFGWWMWDKDQNGGFDEGFTVFGKDSPVSEEPDHQGHYWDAIKLYKLIITPGE